MGIKNQILHNLRASLNESEEEHRLITEKMEIDSQLLNAFVNLRRELDNICNRLSAPPVLGYGMADADLRKREQEYEDKKILKKMLGKKALEQLSLAEEMIREKFGLEDKKKSNKVRSPFGGTVDIGDEEVDDTFDRFDDEEDED